MGLICCGGLGRGLLRVFLVLILVLREGGAAEGTGAKDEAEEEEDEEEDDDDGADGADDEDDETSDEDDETSVGQTEKRPNTLGAIVNHTTPKHTTPHHTIP